MIRFLNKKETINNKDELLYDAKFIGLTTSREILYERINNRVDEMISEGLIEEVKHFYDQKIYSKALMTAIGYKELYEYFDKRISLDQESMQKDNIRGIITKCLLSGLMLTSIILIIQ